MAAADTVALVTAIATKSPPLGASTQQICDCAGKACCGGGWPEDAFAYMLSQGNITAAVDYNYWAQDGRQCAIPTASRIAGSVSPPAWPLAHRSSCLHCNHWPWASSPSSAPGECQGEWESVTREVWFWGLLRLLQMTGWERVPAYSQDALLKAVNMHPVMVYISSSSPDFQVRTAPHAHRCCTSWPGVAHTQLLALDRAGGGVSSLV